MSKELLICAAKTCGPCGQGCLGGPDQVKRVVRLVSLDDMHSENIWFTCLKVQNLQHKFLD